MMRRRDAVDDSLGSEAGAKLMSLIHAHSLVSLLNRIVPVPVEIGAAGAVG
jgi:hypothetical protein